MIAPRLWQFLRTISTSVTLRELRATTIRMPKMVQRLSTCNSSTFLITLPPSTRRLCSSNISRAISRETPNSSHWPSPSQRITHRPCQPNTAPPQLPLEKETQLPTMLLLLSTSRNGREPKRPFSWETQTRSSRWSSRTSPSSFWHPEAASSHSLTPRETSKNAFSVVISKLWSLKTHPFSRDCNTLKTSLCRWWATKLSIRWLTIKILLDNKSRSNSKRLMMSALRANKLLENCNLPSYRHQRWSRLKAQTVSIKLPTVLRRETLTRPAKPTRKVAAASTQAVVTSLPRWCQLCPQVTPSADQGPERKLWAALNLVETQVARPTHLSRVTVLTDNASRRILSRRLVAKQALRLALAQKSAAWAARVRMWTLFRSKTRRALVKVSSEFVFE